MTFDDYYRYFEKILEDPEKSDPYNQEDYLNYTKLNFARLKRWLDRFEPSEETKSKIQSIQDYQHWVVITEPWCGDAAHSVPQIYQMVKDNPFIEFEIQLRDSEPYLIEDYLTGGSKSIPILIIRNDVGHDQLVWGPRPKGATEIFEQLKMQNVSKDNIVEEIQKWYNQDKGESIQKEILQELFK